MPKLRRRCGPMPRANRVDVHLAEWEGDLSDLKGDVIDFELPKAVEACRRGLLEKNGPVQPATRR